MSRIHHLSDTLISQIAAGEVVERPASVVKELVENALDAGATEIRVELEAGGKQRIAVADDGCGMDRDDALLAFDRHATSKIGSFQDLESVGTLGFRGEALATIGAVSRVTLTTAERPGEGTRVAIEGGRVTLAEPFARTRGTTIEVRSLFWNVPARRKFLKTSDTELRRALETVQGYALARPDVRFTVLHEGRALLDALSTEPGEEAASSMAGAARRIGQIFGEPFARQLAEIPAVPLGDTVNGRDGEVISGLIGTPSTARGRRHFLFVNRRLLRDRAILATFYRAVREEWRHEDFPALFLFLDLPPSEVDVNVHPQKAEVRFRDLGFLGRVERALRRGLERARGEEAAPLRELSSSTTSPSGAPLGTFSWQGLGGRTPYGSAGTSFGNSASEIAERPRASELWTPTPQDAPPHPDTSRLATAAYAPIAERAAVPLSGRSGERRPFRLMGQYKGTLILLEGPEGLYLIDQHVAHERILFERLRRSLAATSRSAQHLVHPILLELSAAERLRLLELGPALEKAGFGIAELSGSEVGLTSVPAVLSADEGEKLLRALASSSIGGGDLEGAEGAELLARQILDALAATLSCKSAIKMHHPLAPLEMEVLVAELFAAENPYACPHGRPIVLQMTDSDLERRFGRR
ncbi:MAG TPA: DNA mismatch repair endonuclease MutL [Thermoanaerobaculia bacterium]|jgi:DNA mismatch repair protein MutL|nr:DNA mismatch repair endonuclease MutL [Thermoanaerobaculia bacterium]